MPILLIILLILALPFLLVWLFFSLASSGLERLGLSPELALGVLILMVLGSFLNVPLSRKKFVAAEEAHFFGLIRKRVVKAQGLTLNVGGAVVPLALASYASLALPLVSLLWATGIMTVISKLFSKVIPGKGVGVPLLLPPISAALIALIIAPESPAPLAFASGVFGVLIGADLLNLPKVQREAQGMLSIGGAGVFDAIFLTGVVSALLTAL